MNCLIVYVHPEPTSFNASLRDAAVSKLEAMGHSVVVSDLYASSFYPGMGGGDFLERANPGRFDYRTEQRHAFQSGGYVAEIEDEQAKLAQCDLLILQFPLWWFGPPAVLKGWFDRVLTYGFAYSSEKKFDKGVFKGRRALVSVTTAAKAGMYAPDGRDGDIERILWPVHNGVLRYVGFDVVPPFSAFGVDHSDQAEREATIVAYGQKLERVATETPLFFHDLADYDSNGRLKPGIVARSGFQWNP